MHTCQSRCTVTESNHYKIWRIVCQYRSIGGFEINLEATFTGNYDTLCPKCMWNEQCDPWFDNGLCLDNRGYILVIQGTACGLVLLSIPQGWLSFSGSYYIRTISFAELAEIPTVATYLGMVMWEWCCVVTATLYVYLVDQCHPYIFWFLWNRFYITCCYINIW